jgi:hypothetical protein
MKGSDLAEVRRFWPWMRPSDWFGDKRAFWSRTVRGVQVTVAFHGPVLWSPGWYSVAFFDCRSRRWSKSSPRSGSDFFDDHTAVGPTIAAAMAAAGFGVHKPDKYARQRQQKSRWVAELQRRNGDLFSMTQLESRQRPRKGARLGKRGRRLALAASLVEARQRVAQAAKGGLG